MPVAGTKKYQVKTGTQPEVTVSVHFTQKGEKFFVPIPYELYVKLSDQERKDIGVVFMGSRQVVVGDKFSEAFQKYTKVLDVAHDTVEGIECSPMIFVKFGARVQEATELRYDKDGNKIRREFLVGKDSFFSSEMLELKIDFYRVWHIKSNKREGIIERPLEDCKPDDLRRALDRGFRGDGLGSEGRVFYLPWDQTTWNALTELHGHMHKLISNLSDLLSGDAMVQKLVQASKAGKMLGT